MEEKQDSPPQENVPEIPEIPVIPLIYFECVKVGSKLRVRIISPGYNPEANCQFPRAIRREGARYSAPITDLNFSEMRGKFFYRVKKHQIKIIDGVDELNEIMDQTKISIDNIYQTTDDTDCIICMENEYDVVMVPCGHYCMCNECANKILNSTSKCPICRQGVTMAITRDRIQM